MKALLCICSDSWFLAGEAHAAKNIFDQVSETAPRSSVFEDLNLTAPKGVWDTLTETAPRSDGVFGELDKNAPKNRPMPSG